MLSFQIICDRKKYGSLKPKVQLLLTPFEDISKVPLAVFTWCVSITAFSLFSASIISFEFHRYLLIPFLIGSCMAKTTSVFTNLLVAAMLLSASHGIRNYFNQFFCVIFQNSLFSGSNPVARVMSLVFLALASYQTLYLFLLFPALHLYLMVQNLGNTSDLKFKFKLKLLVF